MCPLSAGGRHLDVAGNREHEEADVEDLVVGRQLKGQHSLSVGEKFWKFVLPEKLTSNSFPCLVAVGVPGMI
jgi:hypothetical protein